MKKFWSKLTVLAMVLVMSIGFTGTAYAYDESAVAENAEQWLVSWNSVDFQMYVDEIQALVDAGTATEEDEEYLALYSSWSSAQSEIDVAAFESVTESNVKDTEDAVVCTLVAKYGEKTVKFSVSYDKAMIETDVASATNATSIKVEVVQSMGEVMAKAGLNTLMGMGIVFLALVFISFIISLLKYIPGIIDKITGKNKKSDVVIEEVPAPVETVVQTDDLELIAVISAAIAAADASAPLGSFTVRSIRRR